MHACMDMVLPYISDCHTETISVMAMHACMDMVLPYISDCHTETISVIATLYVAEHWMSQWHYISMTLMLTEHWGATMRSYLVLTEHWVLQ